MNWLFQLSHFNAHSLPIMFFFFLCNNFYAIFLPLFPLAVDLTALCFFLSSLGNWSCRRSGCFLFIVFRAASGLVFLI